jgi:hypothetical protein
MAADMLQLKNAINEVEQSFGTFTGTVGNYEEAIAEALNTNGDLTKSMSDMDKEMEDLKGQGKENSTEFKGLASSYEDAEKAQKKLSGDMEHLGDEILVEVSGSISKMEDRLFELALQGDKTSDEFISLQKQTAEYKKVIVEVDASIDQMVEGGGAIGGALSIGTGVVSSVQAYTGATALLGGSNEALLETLVKLEAAQAVLNSLEQAKIALDKNSIRFTQMRAKAQKMLNLAIGNGTKGMKLFRGALIATGIGALVVLVGVLVENFDSLKSMLTGVDATQAALNSTLDDFKKGATDAATVTGEVEAAFKLAEAGVISKEEALLTYNTALGDSFGKATDLNEAERIFAEKTPDFIRAAGLRAQAQALFAKSAEEQATALAAQFDDNISLWETSANSLSIIFGDTNEEVKRLQAEGTKDIQDEANKREKIFTDAAQNLLLEAEALDNANGVKTESDRALEAERKRLADEGKKRRDKELKDQEDAAKKALEIALKLRETILSNNELSLSNERKALEAHYTFIESVSKGSAEELVKIEREKNAELVVLEEKELESARTKVADKIAIEQEGLEESSALFISLTNERELQIEAIENQFINRRVQREINTIGKESALLDERVKSAEEAAQKIELIEAELNLEKAKGTALEFNSWKALQDERVVQLEKNRDKEISSLQSDSAERKAIERQTELDILNIKKESFEKEKILGEQKLQNNKDLAVSALSSAQQLSDALFQIASNQNTLELNSATEKFENISAANQSELDANLISQAEFDAKMSEAQTAFDAKEKRLKLEAFKRDRAAQLINATIATAVGVASALPNIPLSILAGTLGAIQIGIISSQPTPTFEKGGQAPLKNGVFGGNLHSSGGTTGSFSDGTNVEVERDEAFFILNRKATGAISNLSSLNQAHGGAPLMKNGGVMSFQGGGSFAAQVGQTVQDRFAAQNAIIQAVSSLPPSIVLVEDINGAQDNLATVQSAADF